MSESEPAAASVPGSRLRDPAFVQSRHAVYRGPASACPSDADPDYQWPFSIVTAATAFSCDNALPGSDTAKVDFGAADARSNPSFASSSARLMSFGSRSDIRRGPSSLDATQHEALLERYLSGEADANLSDSEQPNAAAASARLTRQDVEDDWSEDLAMSVQFSAHGPHRDVPLDLRGIFSWNDRFMKIIEAPDGPNRTDALRETVRAFCEAAVPVARYIVANVSTMETRFGDVMHFEGVTYEVCGANTELKDLLHDNAAGRNKCTQREFAARSHFLQRGSKGIVVPFTIMVESLGCAVLCSPRLPLRRYAVSFDPLEGSMVSSVISPKALGASSGGIDAAASASESNETNETSRIGGMSLLLSSSMMTGSFHAAPTPSFRGDSVTSMTELVYGSPSPKAVHNQPSVNKDPETSYAVQSICERMKLRGHWVGPSHKQRTFVHGSACTQIYRSAIDNRVYATDLRWWMPPTESPDGFRTGSDMGESPVRSPTTSPLKTGARSFAPPKALLAASTTTNPLLTSPASASLSNASFSLSNRSERAHDHLYMRFRPEFLAMHVTSPLNADTAMPFNHVQRSAQMRDVESAATLLLTYVIPQAAKQLVRDVRNCGVSEEMLLGGGLPRFLHWWGINLRFLPEFRAAVEECVPSHERAMMAIEVEMAARAVKQRVVERSRVGDGTGLMVDRSRAEQEVRPFLAALSADSWKSMLVPAVNAKYGSDRAGSLSAGRVTTPRLVQRLCSLIGFTLSRGGVAVTVQQALDAVAAGSGTTSDAADNIGFTFVPRVRCPPLPECPFGAAGYEAHSVAAMQRHLRSLVDSGLAVQSTKLTKRLIVSLQEAGEGTCEEVQLAFSVLETAARNRRSRGKMPAKENEHRPGLNDHGTILRRTRGDVTVKPFTITSAAMQPFGLQSGQRLYLTQGKLAKTEATVIGVRNKVLFIERVVHGGHSADEGAEELPGASLEELVATHGIFVIDPRIAMLQAKLKLHKNRAAPVLNPLTVRTNGGYQVLEADCVATQAQFGFAAGDRLQFRKGTRAGQVTTVLGLGSDQALWHQVDGVGFPEPFRYMDKDSLNANYDFAIFARRTSIGGAPLDPQVVFSGHRKIVNGGHRATAAFGYATGDVLQPTQGPYANELVVVAGVHGTSLSGFLARIDEEQPVELGVSSTMIAKRHAPRRLGAVRRGLPSTPVGGPHVLVDQGAASPISVSTSMATCIARGVAPGQRVRIVSGLNAGCVAIVLGVQGRANVWADVVVDEHGVPVACKGSRVLRTHVEQLFTLSGSVVEQAKLSGDVPADWSPNVPLRSLAAFGEVIDLEADPAACETFGYFHGQLVSVDAAALVRSWPPALRPGGCGEPDTPFSSHVPSIPPVGQRPTIDVAVAGTFRGELWYAAPGVPFVLPFDGSDWWSLFAKYRPAVRGTVSLAPFSDMFATPSAADEIERFVPDPPIAASLYPDWFFPPTHRRFITRGGQVIGLDVTPEAVASACGSRYAVGAPIRRLVSMETSVDPDGTAHHMPAGPTTHVAGAHSGDVYLVGDVNPFGAGDAVVDGAARAAGFIVVSRLPPEAFPLWIADAETEPLSEAPALPTDGIVAPSLATYPVRLRASARVDEPPLCAQRELRAWGHEGEGGCFVSFGPAISLVLDRAVECGKLKAFEGEAVYDLTEMLYTATPRTPSRTMLKKSVTTVESFLWEVLGINVAPLSPRAFMETAYRAQQELDDRGDNERLSVCAAPGSAAVDAYSDAQISALEQAAEAVYDTLLVDLTEQAATSANHGTMRNLRLRLDVYGPESNRALVLRWSLDAFHIEPHRGAPYAELERLFVAVEARVGYLELPSEGEFRALTQSRIRDWEAAEAAARRAICEEEHAFWRRGVEDAPVDFPVELVEDGPSGGSPVQGTRADCFGDEGADAAPKCLYTFRGGATVALAPVQGRTRAGDRLSRGLVIQYTKGDVADFRAQLLGDFNGAIVRRELDTPASHAALRFETSQRADETYGIERVIFTGGAVPPPVPTADRVVWYTWDGSALDLDISFAACQRFGVLSGERYARRPRPGRDDSLDGGAALQGSMSMAPDESANEPEDNAQLTTTSSITTDASDWPFADGAVIAILGVGRQDGKLWFAMDQTGAMPFPVSASHGSRGDIAVEYGLTRVAAGPIHLPKPHPKYMFRFYGMLTVAEAAFLGSSRSVTLTFNIHPASLKAAADATHQQKLVCSAGIYKGTRLAIIGLRHGQVWVSREGEGSARPLSAPVIAHRLKPVLSDNAAKIPTLPLPQLEQKRLMKLTPEGIPTDEALPVFRYLTRTGTIATFDTSPKCESLYGYPHNALIACEVLCLDDTSQAPTPTIAGAAARNLRQRRKSRAATALAKRRSTIGTTSALDKAAQREDSVARKRVHARVVGIRNGLLWRVDDGDQHATPFTGCVDALTLNMTYNVVRADTTVAGAPPLVSWTW